MFSALSVSAPRFHRYSGYQAGSSPNPGANGWTAACVEQHLHLRRLQLHHHHRAQHEWEIHIPQTGGTVSDHGSDRSVPKQFLPLPCVCVCVCALVSDDDLLYQALTYLQPMPRSVSPTRFSPESVWMTTLKQALPPLCWK